MTSLALHTDLAKMNVRPNNCLAECLTGPWANTVKYGEGALSWEVAGGMFGSLMTKWSPDRRSNDLWWSWLRRMYHKSSLTIILGHRARSSSDRIAGRNSWCQDGRPGRFELVKKAARPKDIRPLEIHHGFILIRDFVVFLFGYLSEITSPSG